MMHFARCRFLLALSIVVSAGAGVAQAGVKPQAGVKQQPVVTLSPTSLAFAPAVVGTVTLAQVITLTNTGDATLDITLIKSSRGTTFPLFYSCGATLDPGQSCTVSVVFSPQSAGFVSSQVQFSDNAAGSPQSVKVTGTGTVAGAVTTPTALSFGTVAVGSTSASQTVTLTNQGTTSLSIGSISLSSGDFSLTNNCPSTLAAGGSCSLTLAFTPGAGGTRTGTLSVSDSDFSSPQLVGLSGLATSGTASISPSRLSFGPVEVGSTSPAKTLTLTNSGSTDLAIVNINASGDYAQTSTCRTILPAGSNCSISLTFSPSASGTRAGFVTLSDTDSTNIQTISLTGSGKVRATTVTISPRVAAVTSTQTQQFQAFINGVLSTDVTWTVDGVIGGNSRAGTITTAGLYTPPAAAGAHAIGAVSNADQSQKARVSLTVTNMPGVFTQHNDNLRTGQNTQETVLTTGNVNVNQFGKLFTVTVDGILRVQPLYVPGVNIAGQGVHNVMYVASEHDTAYAFDADGLTTAPLWQTSFIDPGAGITTVPVSDVDLDCRDLGSELGVSGTPVIDSSTNRMFVLARTKDTNDDSYHQWLHALDITSGAEVAGSPVEIVASVTGTGEGSVGGILAFDAKQENSRVALLEANGTIYIGWSSICDKHPYHGWVMGYDANTLAQVAVFNTSPDGQAAGIWQSGAGMAADASGNVYFQTSNGLSDTANGGPEYGESVVKLTPGTLGLSDFFTPFNASALTAVDDDLSSAGALLLPDQAVGPTHLMLGGGKEGVIYLLDRDNMGHFRATDDNQIVQSVNDTGECSESGAGALWGLPAYWQNHVYVWTCLDDLHDYRFYQGLLSTSPILSGSVALDYPPPTPSITSNGSSQGIVWALDEHPFNTHSPVVVYAFDAANITRELWDSTQAGTRDQALLASKGPVPTIANGKVYVSTALGVVVYGLLP
jgi:hypothetical protein